MTTGPTKTAGGEPLHLTGERTVPDIADENYWFRRHQAAYVELLPYCAGATVLEAGCGEGYGAGILAGKAKRVLALDYDRAATTHVARRYPEVTVARANLAFLPIKSSTVDVVVSFQVIEHLWDQAGFLAECHRVLRPGGRLLVTTPNRITFTPDSDIPLNPYHTREFSPSELDSMVRGAGFSPERLLGLHHGPGLLTLDERYGGSIIAAQLDVVFGELPGQATWPSALLADVEAIRASDFVIHGEDLDTSLDLIAVVVRR